MTPVPYITTASRNPATGKFYGKVSYSGTVIAEVPINSDDEFKDSGRFDQWAASEAHAHKASISPEARHTVTKEFVL